MNDKEIDNNAKTIWNYTKMSQTLQPADAIVAMGSMDMRVAERAAELWHEGLAPVIVVTGGQGRLTGTDTSVSEAQKFAEVLRAKAIPEHAILIEDKATNSAENFRFSMQLLQTQNDIEPAKIVAVTQPYMERRAYATAKKLFPNLQLQMASPEVSYEDYPTDAVPRELMVNIMIGELYRIQTYPGKGFTISQDVPAQVETAMQVLVERGFTEQLPE